MENNHKIGRRGFFAGLGLAAGAAVAVKLVPKIDPSPQEPSSEAQQDGRYRLTEHIKKYYRTTAI
jgi:3-deoxy-D-arabino-heptulosonate 7-phosphate (DAHP) synthase